MKHTLTILALVAAIGAQAQVKQQTPILECQTAFIGSDIRTGTQTGDIECTVNGRNIFSVKNGNISINDSLETIKQLLKYKELAKKSEQSLISEMDEAYRMMRIYRDAYNGMVKITNEYKVGIKNIFTQAPYKKPKH